MTVFISSTTSLLKLVDCELNPDEKFGVVMYFDDDKYNSISDILTDYIRNRMQESEIVVCILTDDYLRSIWTLYELDIAKRRVSGVVYLGFNLTKESEELEGLDITYLENAADLMRFVRILIRSDDLR